VRQFVNELLRRQLADQRAAEVPRPWARAAGPTTSRSTPTSPAPSTSRSPPTCPTRSACSCGCIPAT